MDNHSNIDDKVKLAILENNARIREESDNRYAIKLVQKIVFWAIALLAGAVIVGLATLVEESVINFLTGTDRPAQQTTDSVDFTQTK